MNACPADHSRIDRQCPPWCTVSHPSDDPVVDHDSVMTSVECAVGVPQSLAALYVCATRTDVAGSQGLPVVELSGSGDQVARLSSDEAVRLATALLVAAENLQNA